MQFFPLSVGAVVNSSTIPVDHIILDCLKVLYGRVNRTLLALDFSSCLLDVSSTNLNGLQFFRSIYCLNASRNGRKRTSSRRRSGSQRLKFKRCELRNLNAVFISSFNFYFTPIFKRFNRCVDCKVSISVNCSCWCCI